jgi:hypothetical protein
MTKFTEGTRTTVPGTFERRREKGDSTDRPDLASWQAFQVHTQ